jgi:predicted Rossmann fold nucleotide-binding protein DprA/Smf involved in DNA uptake
VTAQRLTEDTEAVLLLCGRFGGERHGPQLPLSAREYDALARWLAARHVRPADLLAAAARTLLPHVHEAGLARERVEFLLNRGTALALALERWSRAGLWVLSRGDPAFPVRVRQRLKHATPALLYGAGNASLLNCGGLAIVGSRDATDETLQDAHQLAGICAREDIGVVSGGARGADAAAMQGAAQAGGAVIGVLANDLLKSSLHRQHRAQLQQGRLVLVSAVYPEAAFNAGTALARNKIIYTLADQALVVQAALRSGGSWEGAIGNLRHRWVPLFVRLPGAGAGNAALVQQGALPFTFSAHRTQSLRDYLTAAAAAWLGPAPEGAQPSLFEGQAPD